MKYPKLDLKTLRMQCYSDTSYANNADRSSQLGYIVFLASAIGNCQLIVWSSRKSKRVPRSTSGIEAMALDDALDMAYTIKHGWQKMCGEKVLIEIFTDSLSLFSAITKAITTLEKRLLFDIVIVKKAYQCHNLQDLGYIRTHSSNYGETARSRQ